MSKETLFRLPDGTSAYLEMNSITQILKDKGLDPRGDVQMFHTQNVLRRILKYMPAKTGMTQKATIAQTNIRKPQIITNTPPAKFLFYGKLMLGDKTGSPFAQKGETKHVTDTPLHYNTSMNAAAGPRWDRALQAAEGAALAADLQRYIKRKGGKG